MFQVQFFKKIEDFTTLCVLISRGATLVFLYRPDFSTYATQASTQVQFYGSAPSRHFEVGSFSVSQEAQQHLCVLGIWPHPSSALLPFP